MDRAESISAGRRCRIFETQLKDLESSIIEDGKRYTNSVSPFFCTCVFQTKQFIGLRITLPPAVPLPKTIAHIFLPTRHMLMMLSRRRVRSNLYGRIRRAVAIAGVQMPLSTEVETTRLHASCDFSIISLKNGSSSRG